MSRVLLPLSAAREDPTGIWYLFRMCKDETPAFNLQDGMCNHLFIEVNILLYNAPILYVITDFIDERNRVVLAD